MKEVLNLKRILDVSMKFANRYFTGPLILRQISDQPIPLRIQFKILLLRFALKMYALLKLGTVLCSPMKTGMRDLRFTVILHANNQWRASFINENAISFVDNGEVSAAGHRCGGIGGDSLQAIPQEVETKFLGRTIGNVTPISCLALSRRQRIGKKTSAYPQ